MCDQLIKVKQFDEKYIPAKYINRYISLGCPAKMQELKLFPNVKEVCETFSLYDAIWNYIYPLDNNIIHSNENISYFVGGGGVSPRTAGFFLL